MKLTKILLSTLCGATLALTLSACNRAAVNDTTTANAANKPNAAVVVNSNQTSVNKTNPPSNAAPTGNKASSRTASTDNSDAEKISGELQTGKSESVILYVGEETGDYAAYCFANNSEAGRAILDACKDGERCEVRATTGEGSCQVPGLEADLSASAKILKVESAKSLGSRK